MYVRMYIHRYTGLAAAVGVQGLANGAVGCCGFVQAGGLQLQKEKRTCLQQTAGRIELRQSVRKQKTVDKPKLGIGVGVFRCWALTEASLMKPSNRSSLVSTAPPSPAGAAGRTAFNLVMSIGIDG